MHKAGQLWSGLSFYSHVSRNGEICESTQFLKPNFYKNMIDNQYKYPTLI